MIKLVRIDHRLLHGQTAFTWLKFCESDCVLIASDALMKDELKMSAIRLAKPAGIKLVMKNMEDSIKAINSGVTDKYKLFILVENVEDAYHLAMGCPAIQSINLGGMKAGGNRHQISKAVFVDDNDIHMLKELNCKGIELEIRMVPNDERQDAMKLI